MLICRTLDRLAGNPLDRWGCHALGRLTLRPFCRLAGGTLGVAAVVALTFLPLIPFLTLGTLLAFGTFLALAALVPLRTLAFRILPLGTLAIQVLAFDELRLWSTA